MVAGPILAVHAQRCVVKYGERQQRQHALFCTLMATRATNLSFEHVGATNTVPLDFITDKKIMSKWRLYLDHVNGRGANIEVRGKRRVEHYNDMLASVAERLGHKNFDAVHLKNEVYAPQGHARTENEAEEIRRGMVPLMKGNKALPTEVRSIAHDEEAAEHLMGLQKAIGSWLRGETVPSLSGVLCVRHIMSTERSMYAKASQEDAAGQRGRASGDLGQDTAGVA